MVPTLPLMARLGPLMVLPQLDLRLLLHLSLMMNGLILPLGRYSMRSALKNMSIVTRVCYLTLHRIARLISSLQCRVLRSREPFLRKATLIRVCILMTCMRSLSTVISSLRKSSLSMRVLRALFPNLRLQSLWVLVRRWTASGSGCATKLFGMSLPLGSGPMLLVKLRLLVLRLTSVTCSLCALKRIPSFLMATPNVNLKGVLCSKGIESPTRTGRRLSFKTLVPVPPLWKRLGQRTVMVRSLAIP